MKPWIEIEKANSIILTQLIIKRVTRGSENTCKGYLEQVEPSKLTA